MIISGAGTAYPSGAPKFTPGFEWDSCYSIFSFMCMFCPFILFLLAIVLSVLLPYSDSDCLPLVSSNSSYLVDTFILTQSKAVNWDTDGIMTNEISHEQTKNG